MGDTELKEIRDTRAELQTRLINMEATLEDHNFEIPRSSEAQKSKKGDFDVQEIRAQFENELRREADLIRLEINEKLRTGDMGSSMTNKNQPQNTIQPDEFGELLMKTE